MTESSKGRLFVLSGPSGAGKGTLRKKIFESVQNILFSISYTTRSPREGERDGTDYRFVSKVEFRKLKEQGKFLEYAQVHGQFYGTLQKEVEKALEQGKDVILEIDVQGGLQVRKKMPDSVLIFVFPPSLEELEYRLRERGTENEEILQLRLRNARMEIEKAKEYDHTILNDDVYRASDELKNIILGYREKKEVRS